MVAEQQSQGIGRPAQPGNILCDSASRRARQADAIATNIRLIATVGYAHVRAPRDGTQRRRGDSLQ